MASTPFSASATTSMSGSPLVAVASPMRITMWSSTSRILIVVGLTDGCMRGGERCRQERRDHFDHGAFARGAVNLQETTDLAGPLSHAAQAEMAEMSHQYFLRAESTSIVGHRERKALGVVNENNGDVPGRSVPHRVRDRLLRDAKQVMRGRGR